ncbi:MAG: hypothetical protein HYV93_22640 [Candidatus Rokubacteria bacterium]|nr:hypothetical protein [Candidatus Rokubacteria bacterium]
MRIAERAGNLLGVPSCHFDPIFAREARRAVTAFHPTAVAVELRPSAEDEVDWALSCWPSPVASLSGPMLFPFVPGDSILEACRLARGARWPLYLVDLEVSAGARRERGLSLPGPEFAPRVGRLFREAHDALAALGPAPPDEDLAREAHMARRLSELLAAHQRVLWVGGLAHWTALVRRLEAGDFAAPSVPISRARRFRRVRLAPSALLRLSGRVPYLVAHYASGPDRYEETAAVRGMALGALRRPARSGQPADGPAGTAIDVARALLYARNLAASRGLSERPDLGELLTAASATIGNRYAGALYMLAMRDLAFRKGRQHPALTFEVIGKRQGFRLDGRWVTVEPFLVQGPGITISIPSPDEAERRRGDTPYRHVPPGKAGETRIWVSYPPEEEQYEAFVRYVLGRATVGDPAEARSAPFVSGLRDGVDVRATLRHWKDGTVYVHEGGAEPLRVTNGIIDFISAREDSRILRGGGDGKDKAGWVDPSYEGIGSASREASEPAVLQDEPCHVTLRRRDFSMISLDAPTWLPAPDTKSFYARVITPLLALPRSGDDHLYGWLDVMFAFCERKPVVYYSRYVPGQRIHAIARAHRVRLLHRLLAAIPRPLLERNGRFRFLHLTRSQWDALHERVREGKRAWLATGEA